MPEALLTDLRDIHLPKPVSAWPPGPGYFVLLALFVSLVLLYILHKKKLQKTAAKREALARLTRIKTRYLEGANAKETAAEITVLLKQVALVYHPRTDVAGLHGEKWMYFLQKTSQNIDFEAIQTSLLDTPFNPHATCDLTLLFEAARHWIKQRRKPCLN